MKLPSSDRYGSILIREDREDDVPPGVDPDTHVKGLHAACRRSVEEQAAITRAVHPPPTEPIRSPGTFTARGPPKTNSAPPPPKPPSDKQVAYLNQLQKKAGQPQTVPDTAVEASRAIDLLLGRKA